MRMLSERLNSQEPAHPDPATYQLVGGDAEAPQRAEEEEEPEAGRGEGEFRTRRQSVKRDTVRDVLERITSPAPVARSAREKAVELMNSLWFQVVVAVTVLANAAVIGMETDHPDMLHWNLIEYAFLVLFAAELALRMVVFTPQVLFHPKTPDFNWNCFDFFIVTIGIMDMALDIMMRGHAMGQIATLFRVIRLLRILRIFRIVRFLKQLYMLAFGMMLAAEAIMWVTILMLVTLYVCSIILVRTVGNLKEETEYDFLHENYSTIPKSMFSLFKLMVNPFLDPYEGVLGHYAVLTVFIVGFVIFGSFGMIALLTGVIQENMFEKNQIRAEEKSMEREAKRQRLVQRCGDLFDLIAPDGEGIPRDRYPELTELIPHIVDLFKEQGVPLVHEDLAGVIEVMDADDSGVIDKEEFCSFFLTISEGMRPLLLMELRHDIMHHVNTEMRTWHGQTVKQNEEQLAAVQRLSEELKAACVQINSLHTVQPSTSQLRDEIVEVKSHASSMQDGIKEIRELLVTQQERVKVQFSEGFMELSRQLLGSEVSRTPDPPLAVKSVEQAEPAWGALDQLAAQANGDVLEISAGGGGTAACAVVAGSVADEEPLTASGAADVERPSSDLLPERSERSAAVAGAEDGAEDAHAGGGTGGLAPAPRGSMPPGSTRAERVGGGSHQDVRGAIRDSDPGRRGAP